MTARRDWVRTAAFAVLIGSAVVLSYATLHDVALDAGFAPWAAWLYPPAVDALILVASRVWRDASLATRTRRTAAVVTVASIAAGVAAFVTQHARYGPVGVGFAVVVPLALAAGIVLTSWSATDRREAAVEQERREAERQRRASQQHRTKPATRAGSESASGASVTRLRSTTGKADPKRAWVRQQFDAGVEVAGADVDREFGGSRNGARVVRQVRAERNGHAEAVR